MLQIMVPTRSPSSGMGNSWEWGGLSVLAFRTDSQVLFASLWVVRKAHLYWMGSMGFWPSINPEIIPVTIIEVQQKLYIYMWFMCIYIYMYRYTYMILHPVSGIDPTTAIRKSRMAPRHERTPNGRWDSPPRSRRRLTDTPALGHSVCSSRCSLLVGKSTLDMWEIHNPRVVDGFPKETWVFHIYMFLLVVYLPLWKNIKGQNWDDSSLNRY